MRASVFILLLVFLKINATAYNVSSRLYVEHISGNDYKRVLELYQDCQGPTLPSLVVIHTLSLGNQSYDTISLHSIVYILDSCLGTSNCISPTGTFVGIEERIYQDTVTLTNPTTFSYSHCCLDSLENITYTGNVSPYIECFIDPQGGTNNSVEVNNFQQLLRYYSSPPVDCILNIYEQDGDSVVISSSPVYDSNAQNPVTYAPGYSANQPLGINQNFSVNNNGEIQISPNQLGNFLLCFKIESYRSGILNSSQIFTALSSFYALLCPTGISPTVVLEDLPSSTVVDSKKPINVIEGVTYKYLVKTSSHISTAPLAKYHTLPNGMSINLGTGPLPVDTLTWIPTTAQVNTFETLKLKVRDSSCYMGCGIEQEKFHFKILPAVVTDSVWPGDVDWNHTVDITDPVLVGVAYGATGTMRTNASNLWVAQASADWNTSFASGINHKHADCNGDGRVDSMDLVSISSNWGYVHNKKESYKTTSTLPIYISNSYNNNTRFDIALGTNSEPANNVYAVSFDLEIYNRDGTNHKNWTQYPIQLLNYPSWFSYSYNLLPFYKAYNQHSMHMVLTKKNQQASSGYGDINTIILDPSMASHYSDVKIKNAVIYDQTGEPIDTLAETSAVFDITSVQSLESDTLKLYPNPTEDWVTVELEPSEHDKIMTLYDVQGREVMQIEVLADQPFSSFNLKDIDPGLYLLKTTGGESIKILKQ